MRVKLAFIPYFGKEGEQFNNTKGKTYLVLYTHPREWVRPMDLAASTGLNKRSLFVLMAKWAGPTWHTLERKKIAGFYCYRLTDKGITWFNRWHELMPIKRWQLEIERYQNGGKQNG